jgi:hypothetical protein
MPRAMTHAMRRIPSPALARLIPELFSNRLGAGCLFARRGNETADRGHQSCSVAWLNLEAQRTRPRGVLNISRTRLMSVDDEWNQPRVGILPKLFREIERPDQSGTIEVGCDDGWPLLEDISEVDVLGCNRRHSVPRTREGLSVSLIPHAMRFNQQYERLRVTVSGMPGCGHEPEPEW